MNPNSSVLSPCGTRLRLRQVAVMELKEIKRLLGVAEDDASQDIPLQFALNIVEEF